MHFHCDIAVILHRVQADTLDANLQQKTQGQNENPLYICGETVHIFFMAKTLGISVEKMFLYQKPFAYTVHTAFEFTSLQQWEKH